MQDHWSHDIRDPEAFVSRIVALRGGELDFHQRERLQQFLLIALWELSLVFEPGGIRFSTYAGNTLPRRITDWRRSPEEGGRTKWQFKDRIYERPRVHVSSLDQLEPALPEVGVEAALPSDPALLRILRPRGGKGARQDEGVGGAGTRSVAA